MQMAGEPTHRCVGFMLGQALGVIFARMRCTRIMRERRAGRSQLVDRGPHLTTGIHVLGKTGVEKLRYVTAFARPAEPVILFLLYIHFPFSPATQ
jgi:hypothetical protein